MSGRSGIRNPTTVTLTSEHAALIDTLALVNYGAPRNRVVAALLDRILPKVLAEVRREQPGRLREAEKTIRRLRAQGGSSLAGVVDLAQRREARKRTRDQDRM